MSWRRFIVLLAGLSAASRWQHALQGDGEQPRVLEGDALEQWVARQKAVR